MQVGAAHMWGHGIGRDEILADGYVVLYGVHVVHQTNATESCRRAIADKRIAGAKVLCCRRNQRRRQCRSLPGIQPCRGGRCRDKEPAAEKGDHPQHDGSANPTSVSQWATSFFVVRREPWKAPLLASC